MGTRVSWSVSASVADGPSFTSSQSRLLEAYGKIDATVPADDGSPGMVTVEVQPSDDAEDLLFFAITASSYGDDLTFSVKTGVSGIVLDGALLLSGASIGGLLGAPPEEVTFTNAGGAAVEVEIIVGRQAEVGS
jgi:hypothetical protein